MYDKRTELEQRMRAAERLEGHRERLLALSIGGSSARPYEVTSVAVIEPRVIASIPCVHCGGEHRVLEHTRPMPGLRRVDAQCRQCNALRTLWFRLVADELD